MEEGQAGEEANEEEGEGDGLENLNDEFDDEDVIEIKEPGEEEGKEGLSRRPGRRQAGAEGDGRGVEVEGRGGGAGQGEEEAVRGRGGERSAG